MNHYREIVAEIAAHIDASGLYDAAESLTAVTVGPADLSHLLGNRWRVIHGSDDLDAYEFPTLQLLHDESRGRFSSPVLYLHTKGVRWPVGDYRRHRDSWRRYMLHHVVDQWWAFVSCLVDRDIAGVEWIEKSAKYHPHFSGNFWWSRSEYLETLPTPTTDLPLRAKHPRYLAEFWVGMGKPEFCSMRNLGAKYSQQVNEFPEDLYRDRLRIPAHGS